MGENTTTNTANQENKKEKSLKKCNITTTIFMILTILAYVVITAYLLYGMVDAMQIEENEVEGLGIALFMIFGILVIGSIGYVITMIFSLVGLIVTSVNIKYGASKGKLALFIIFMILPILTEIALFVICKFITG